MTPPGTPPGPQNPAVYRTLKDVLGRRPELCAVRYEPDAIQKRYLSAEVDPRRVTPPTGPATPTVEVRWKTTPPHDEFRVDYADPNRGFHCGWHRDGDHPEFGAVHFQYRTSAMDEPAYESAAFEPESPARILWTALDRLFGRALPRLATDG